MATLRTRIADLERSKLPRTMSIVHVILVASAVEERAESERLAREAPHDEHVFVRLMGPSFEGWPEEALAHQARKATIQ